MLLAGIGVVLGAWGAHGLEAYQLAHFGTADPSSWKTAVLYQFVHALALLAIGGVGLHRTGRLARIGGWCLVLGCLCFSGSLYGLTLGGPRWLGLVTPLGGSILILGWFLLIVALPRARSTTLD